MPDTSEDLENKYFVNQWCVYIHAAFHIYHNDAGNELPYVIVTNSLLYRIVQGVHKCDLMSCEAYNNAPTTILGATRRLSPK